MKEKQNVTEIANIIQEALRNHPEIGEVTHMMYTPIGLEPTMGIMVDTDKGTRLAFRVNVQDLSLEKYKDV